mmetsp:Transcript_31335/g.82953  ORF Transcript_31335/g.82953 Transcript_31335/m.82953 type:complete len:119 (+) Transcript_31335:100-456(+)
MVLHYLHGVCAQVWNGEVPEDRIMPIMQTNGTFGTLVAFLGLHWSKLQAADLQLAAEALAYICDSEDFQTYEEQYATASDMETLGLLYASFLESMAADGDQRRKLRPLLDFVQRSQYK